MLRYLLCLAIILNAITTATFANGNDPYPPSPYDVSHGVSNSVPNLSPNGLPPPSNAPITDTDQPTISATIYPGSIKENVQRLAHDFGWPQVVWNSKYDFRWVGQTQMHATNLEGIFNQLLAGYPLQAVFYQGNHILAIYPRYLK